jgi:hypothetical protein
MAAWGEGAVGPARRDEVALRSAGAGILRRHRLSEDLARAAALRIDRSRVAVGGADRRAREPAANCLTIPAAPTLLRGDRQSDRDGQGGGDNEALHRFFLSLTSLFVAEVRSASRDGR